MKVIPNAEPSRQIQVGSRKSGPAPESYLKSNPLTFMRDYITQTKVPVNNYHQFSKEFERIVERLELRAGLEAFRIIGKNPYGPW
jgi:hypothetical protein